MSRMRNRPVFWFGAAAADLFWGHVFGSLPAVVLTAAVEKRGFSPCRHAAY